MTYFMICNAVLICCHRFCETQLLSLVHDHSIQTDLVLMELFKAFDHVPHERLLYKLHWYDVRNHISGYVPFCVMGCIQQVVLDGGATSSTVPIVTGSYKGQCWAVIYI